jgi:hypothetical protein
LICHLRVPGGEKPGRYALISEKARGVRAKIPGGSSGTQAARNTGPVIRIAIAKRREKLVMAWLLADDATGIKRGIQGMRPLSRPTS